MDFYIKQSVSLFLQRKLHEMRLKNAHYSQNSLAKKLGMSSGSLSLILKGKRLVSFKAAQSIGNKLNLSETEMAVFLAPYETIRVLREGVSYKVFDQEKVNDNLDALDYSILSALNLDMEASFNNLVYKFKHIELALVTGALDKLERLNIVSKNDKLIYVRNMERIMSTDGTASERIQELHRRDLEIATGSLTEVPVSLRDFSSITMAISRRKIPLAVSLIRKFQDDLSLIMEGKDSVRTDVYKLCVQLFPLSFVEEEESSNKGQ
jgi:transcriptional regulator with XRE-family HTH domain